jgi:membrane protein implicated in regulation of membrane protease activity
MDGKQLEQTSRLYGPQDHAGRVVVRRHQIGSGVQAAAILLGAVPTVILLIIIPMVVLSSDMDIATKMGVVQAATSWWSAVLALIASIVALIAYRNSIQRPDLELRAKNSLSVIELTLTNTGNASALKPVVRVRVGNEGVLNWRGANVGWNYEEFDADGYYRVLTWYGDEVVVHPGFKFTLPFIDLDPPSNSGLLREWPTIVTWICEGGQSKEQDFKFVLPSAR